MSKNPVNDSGRPPRRLSALVLVLPCVGLLLAACGGGQEAPVAVTQVPIALEAQPAAGPVEGSIVGQTTVVLNTPPAPTAPARTASQLPESEGLDPATTVAVAQDRNGNVLLERRDGGTRVVAPDGKISLHPGRPPAEEARDLPESLIVAVDSANTVHMVDSAACLSRRITPDGRVSTTALPASTAGAPCGAARPAR